jgi:HD-like signal output (HDOD) protein
MDPVLAGHILQAANSYLSPSVIPVCDLERAVAQIGMNAAQCVIICGITSPNVQQKKVESDLESFPRSGPDMRASGRLFRRLKP